MWYILSPSFEWFIKPDSPTEIIHISSWDLFDVGKQDVHLGDQGTDTVGYYTISLMCNSW